MKQIAFAFASCALSLGLPAVAQAATAVYPGCAVPSLKAGYHTFYVDPVKGSSAGDGSAAKPWKTLAEVLGASSTLLSTQGHKKTGGDDPLVSINPNGKIKAGDIIMLMSGNHGTVVINNAFNKDFVTVMAGPGQTPVVSQLSIKSSAKWMFQGVKFQGEDVLNTTKTVYTRDTQNLVQTGSGEWLGASSDLVFTNSSFSTADQTSSWSDVDWMLKPYYYSFISSSQCTSLVNNQFNNVLDAVGVTKPNFLAQGNTITNFSNDGFDVVASNVIIKGNSIKGGMNNKASNLHPDGIQGWSAVVNGVTTTNKNVLIDGNIIVKVGDPNVSFMQGITAFDGKWDGLTIQNNVVVTNHWHGIAIAGAQNLKILNNTVMASEPVNHVTWIKVDAAKDGTHSANVIVRNNISPTLVMNDSGITYDHNIVNRSFIAMVASKGTNFTKSVTSLAMTVLNTLPSQFVAADNATGEYDLRLKAGSSLIGSGSSALAPASDIVGKKRAAAVDLGAYQH